MLRTSVLALTGAALAFALNGCVVYTNSGAPPPARQPSRTARPPARTQPAPTAQPPQRQPIGIGHRTPATPTATPTTTPQQPAPVAPTITSPIIFGNGTGGTFRGQAYVLPVNTQRLPDLGQLVPFATLFTRSFQVSPQEFSGGFPGALRQDDWFAIRYEGSFSVPNDGSYGFELTSDDGAILYIDGQKVVDNDGVHGVKTTTGRTQLKRGFHLLRLDYFQAQRGRVALTLLIDNGAGKTPLGEGLQPR